MKQSKEFDKFEKKIGWILVNGKKIDEDDIEFMKQVVDNNFIPNSKVEKLLEQVILVEAIGKFNSTPQVGEKIDVEKHNYTNKMLNEMNIFIHTRLLNSLIKK